MHFFFLLHIDVLYKTHFIPQPSNIPLFPYRLSGCVPEVRRVLCSTGWGGKGMQTCSGLPHTHAHEPCSCLGARETPVATQTPARPPCTHPAAAPRLDNSLSSLHHDLCGSSTNGNNRGLGMSKKWCLIHSTLWAPWVCTQGDSGSLEVWVTPPGSACLWLFGTRGWTFLSSQSRVRVLGGDTHPMSWESSGATENPSLKTLQRG